MRFQLTPQKVDLSEDDVIDDCRRVLRQRGYWLKRNHVGRFRTIVNTWITMGCS
jgi:hypothetical protein